MLLWKNWRRKILEREFKIWRGDGEKGEFINYSIKLEKGMVVWLGRLTRRKNFFGGNFFYD